MNETLTPEFLEPIMDTTQSTKYTVYIDEEVKEPSYYRYVCELLLSASEDDSFLFYINTSGGFLSGAVSLVTSMRSSKAAIHGVLIGDAMSAGSAIFLSCDTFQVSPLASMMVHTSSYMSGYMKHSDHRDAMHYSDAWMDNFIKVVYFNFLTEEEIDQVKAGRDVYLNSEQISERLEEKVKKDEDDFKASLEGEVTEGDIKEALKELAFDIELQGDQEIDISIEEPESSIDSE